MDKSESTAISVVIPSYNEATYIDRLLEALSRQVFQDFEVVVSDAESKDGTADVVERYQDKLDLRLLQSPPNGPSDGRNRGAAVARGDWLLFLDADVDLPDTAFLQKLHDVTIESGWQTSSAKLAVNPASSSLVERVGTAGNYRYIKLLAKTKHPVAPGFCIYTKRSLFREMHGFNEKIKYGEDYDYVSRAGRAKGFGFVEETYYYMDLRRMRSEGARFVIKNTLNEVYRHTHRYNLENNPLTYEFGKHDARKK